MAIELLFIVCIFFQFRKLTPFFQKTGVFEIECGDFNALSIGQTGRALRKRVAEHDSAVNTLAPLELADVAAYARILMYKKFSQFYFDEQQINCRWHTLL